MSAPWGRDRRSGQPSHLPRHPHASALFTDLYELTMARAYHAERMDATAVFELHFREMPTRRNYMIAAGIGDVLEALEHLRFTDEDVNYLSRLEQFRDDRSFLDRLRSFRFTGDVHAVPEGTPVFPHEPIVQVVAPVIEAQLIETLVLNQVHVGTVLASKAARVVRAARGRAVVDFGSRRAHGSDAALKAARLTYLVGGAGTSNVLAGKMYGIPVFGTMAHSYIQAHESEDAAFEAFARLYPDTTLLVDTYDTIEGVKKVVALAKKLGENFRVRAIRLDSGDMANLAKQSRGMLDEAGLHDVGIFISSGLDEYRIEKMLADGVPVNGFGVGTKMVVSSDVTDVDMAYKLVEYAGAPRTKLSTGKELYPGRKQVYRVVEDGTMTRDVLALHHEHAEGRPLLVQMMRGGERTDAGRTSLAASRAHAIRGLDELPPRLHALAAVEVPYAVEPGLNLAPRIREMQRGRHLHRFANLARVPQAGDRRPRGDDRRPRKSD